MSQLTKLDRFVSRRRELADQYKLSLANIDERIRPICAPSGVEPGWHLFRVLIEFDEFKLDRGGWMDELKKHGIGSQVHYIPVHTQPYYHGRYGAVELEGARQYYDRTLTLPLHPGMSDQDVSTVSSVLSEIARSHG
jgi:dTDP-4-amino-4,6-dideoxygalactose transaminase